MDEPSHEVHAKPAGGGECDDQVDDVAELLRATAHDAASPLANILLIADIMQSTEAPMSAAELGELGANVGAEGERLRRMVDTLLMWYRLETQNHELRRRWQMVEELVDAAVRGLGEILDKRRVVTTIEPDMAQVYGDPVLLETVLMNLIANAASFSADDGVIEIRARTAEQRCEVRVLDDGEALGCSETCRVDARRHFRAGRPGVPGGGLGLVVTRRIIEEHDGEIWARDRHDGRGAVFGFTLQFDAAPPSKSAQDIPPMRAQSD